MELFYRMGLIYLPALSYSSIDFVYEVIFSMALIKRKNGIRIKN